MGELVTPIKLTPEQDALISTLLGATASIEEAARINHISERRARSWLALPHVRQVWATAHASVATGYLMDLKQVYQQTEETVQAQLRHCTEPALLERALIIQERTGQEIALVEQHLTRDLEEQSEPISNLILAYKRAMDDLAAKYQRTP